MHAYCITDYDFISSFLRHNKFKRFVPFNFYDSSYTYGTLYMKEDMPNYVSNSLYSIFLDETSNK